MSAQQAAEKIAAGIEAAEIVEFRGETTLLITRETAKASLARCRDEFGFDFSWAPTNRLNFKLKSYYRNYDYPNAFAFHNPAGGVRSLETTRANLLGDFRITPLGKQLAPFRQQVGRRRMVDAAFRRYGVVPFPNLLSAANHPHGVLLQHVLLDVTRGAEDPVARLAKILHGRAVIEFRSKPWADTQFLEPGQNMDTLQRFLPVYEEWFAM